MNRIRLPRRTYANVTATLALLLAFGALAGTAFSGGSAVPGKNGVKASDIAKGAVKRAKIANNAVNGTKANEASFGSPLLRGFIRVTDTSASGTGERQAFPTCPPGYVLLGGGGRVQGDDNVKEYALTVLLPIVDDPARQLFVQANDMSVGEDDPYTVTGYATCAKI